MAMPFNYSALFLVKKWLGLTRTIHAARLRDLDQIEEIVQSSAFSRGRE